MQYSLVFNIDTLCILLCTLEVHALGLARSGLAHSSPAVALLGARFFFQPPNPENDSIQFRSLADIDSLQCTEYRKGDLH